MNYSHLFAYIDAEWEWDVLGDGAILIRLPNPRGGWLTKTILKLVFGSKWRNLYPKKTLAMPPGVYADDDPPTKQNEPTLKPRNSHPDPDCSNASES